MGNVIAVVGKSGDGKSTSLKTLNPEETLIINADRKPLPFKGWSDIYSKEKKNYLETSQPATIKRIIGEVETNPDAKNIKIIVIDTANAIMIDDEMRRMAEKGYDKWQDLAVSIYSIIDRAQQQQRKDLNIYFFFHEESFLDDDGIRSTRILTNGKKLNKINIASRITTILWAKCEMLEKGKNRFYFETRKNNNEAKSPEGMFSDFDIPNDLAAIDKAIRE